MVAWLPVIVLRPLRFLTEHAFPPHSPVPVRKADRLDGDLVLNGARDAEHLQRGRRAERLVAHGWIGREQANAAGQSRGSTANLLRTDARGILGEYSAHFEDAQLIQDAIGQLQGIQRSSSSNLLIASNNSNNLFKGILRIRRNND